MRSFADARECRWLRSGEWRGMVGAALGASWLVAARGRAALAVFALGRPRGRAGGRAGVRGLLGLVTAGGVWLVGASSAFAAPSPVCDSGTGACTTTFGFAGQVVSWAVPAGVPSAAFTVSGAQGGGASFGTAGLGGEVVATLGSLVRDDMWGVSVGGAGGSVTLNGSAVGAGGFNGGGGGGTDSNTNEVGAGGGGYSAVTHGSTLQLLAGGGGGAGLGNPSAAGGAGGAGGATGTNGGSGGSTVLNANGGSGGLAGGNGATGGAGGSGESLSGGAGAAGGGLQGGGGVANAGGGGGGGYIGGGQGGGGGVTAAGTRVAGGNGGGGGGSSFAAPGIDATFTTGAQTGNGQIAIAYPDPIAGGDATFFATGSVLSIAAPGPLADATGPASDPLSAVLTARPTHGTLTLNSDGSFSYTPDAGFAGTDSFTYRAIDSYGDYATATVTLNVTPDTDLALTGVPANITTDATSAAGAVVSYTPPTATDEGSDAPSVGCDPRSGSTFPIGTTMVTCTATDSDDINSPVTATFTVTVDNAPTQLTASPELVLLPPGGVGLVTVGATLTSFGEPVAGRTITFTTGRTLLCSAVTAGNGKARCGIGLVAELAVLLANSYTATFAGDTDFLPSTGTTGAVELIGPGLGTLAAAGRRHVAIKDAVLSGHGIRFTIGAQPTRASPRRRHARWLSAGRYTLTVTLTDGRVLRRKVTFH